MRGQDKMWSGADLRGASPLVSFNHVIDPHLSASPAVCVQQFAALNLTLTQTLTLILTLTLTQTLTLILTYSDH